jgi:hypothetical protein
MWLGYEVDHSPPSSTEVNSVWSFTFIPLIHTEKKIHKICMQEKLMKMFSIKVFNSIVYNYGTVYLWELWDILPCYF